jgi:hypothetical protein
LQVIKHDRENKKLKVEKEAAMLEVGRLTEKVRFERKG